MDNMLYCFGRLKKENHIYSINIERSVNYVQNDIDDEDINIKRYAAMPLQSVHYENILGFSFPVLISKTFRHHFQGLCWYLKKGK